MTFKVGDRVRGRLAGCCGTVQGFTKDGLLIVEVGSNDIRAWADDDAVEKLPPEPEQVVRWAYLWENEHGVMEPRMATAETNPVEPWGEGLSGHKCVARARVVLKPGQFDDENTPDPHTKGWNEALARAVDELDEVEMYERDRISARQAIRALKRSAP